MTSNTGSEPVERSRAVVAGHGDFAAGMISAVGRICGQEGCFAAFTNQGLCGDDLMQSLARVVDSVDARVVFTDLPAGSATMAARRLQGARPGLVVVTGVNVAVLLDFALRGSAVTPEEAAAHAVERGRAAVAVLPPPVALPPVAPAAPRTPPLPAASSGGTGA